MKCRLETESEKMKKAIMNIILNIKDKAENKPPKPKKPKTIDKWIKN